MKVKKVKLVLLVLATTTLIASLIEDNRNKL